MKLFQMWMVGLALWATWGTGAGAQDLTSEESRAILQKMMDSLPADRWIERGVLEINHTRLQNDGQAVLVQKITNYVEPNLVLQEFQVVSQTGNMELPVPMRPEAKKAIDTAKELGTLIPPPTKRITLMEQERFLTYASEPFHSATIDESGRFPYQQYNLFLSAGLFQKQGFLSPENLRLATVSGKKGPAANLLEITVARPDFTVMIALDPKTLRPLSCKIDDKNERSQLWEYEWANDGRSIPAQVTITKKSKKSSEVDNFRYQLVSDATKAENFRVEFAYGTPVQYFPPPNSNSSQSIVYIHNPAIDVQALIARRFQFALSPQKAKNCATAVLNAVEDRFGVAFGDTSAIVHIPDANPVDGKKPVGTTSAIEIRDMVRSKGLYSEIVRTDIEHLAALGKDTMAIMHLPNRRHFTIFVGVYGGKDVWVSQSDTRKCLYILNRGDLDAWKGTTILISSKPIPLAGGAG
ncbi:MAG: hypothetical protein NTZ17_19535 [Phycisphaerae bacterium]|nr:hypothetical protein [Phycisphaerae bacterium]